MLSYNTIVAIQLLHVLQKFKHRPMSITELRHECLLHDMSNVAGKIMRTLYRQGWVTSIAGLNIGLWRTCCKRICWN